MRIRPLLLALLIVFVVPARGLADDWRTAWNASFQPVWDDTFVLPAGVPTPLAGRTIVQRVRLQSDGEAVRIVLSNRYGAEAVRIAAATSPGRGAFRFGGQAGVVLPPGQEAASDPAPWAVTGGEALDIALTLSAEPSIGGFHWDGGETLRVLDDAGAEVETATVRLFLARVLVRRPDACGALLALGDSLTDGNNLPLGQNQRWTDHLVRGAGGRTVVNAGISGARLLSDGMGEAAGDRLEQELDAHDGLEAVLVALGTNDVAWPGSPFAPDEPATTLAALQSGYAEIAQRIRARGLTAVGVTLPPFRDALPGTPMAGRYHTAEKERLRLALNAWLRTSHPFDTLVDLDAVLRDPARPDRLTAAFDSGDHLHPNPAGHRAIAAAIDLSDLLSCP